MSVAADTSIVIRDIDSRSEMRAVEDLQKEIWGVPDLDVVPLSHLAAVIHSGGVLLGAFDKDALIGFVYGFVGREHGASVHHSHMLAVKDEYRSHEVGLRLKLAQRERVLEQGIATMTWTFDPLQSLNAYFNFNKLGVTADRYFVNFYGEDASSFLHRNGTDRLWVRWMLAGERVAARLDRKHSASGPADVPAVVRVGENDMPVGSESGEIFSNGCVAIEIPADINLLERQNRELASEWRNATRRAFSRAIARGFSVEEFHRTGRKVGTYILTRNSGG